MIYIIPLPWATPPLTLNQRMKWPQKYRVTDTAKQQAQWAIKAARIPHLPHIAKVELCWEPSTNRRRDEDNLYPSLKVCADALVAEGVIDDDSTAYIAAHNCRILPASVGKRGRLWLEVTP